MKTSPTQRLLRHAAILAFAITVTASSPATAGISYEFERSWGGHGYLQDQLDFPNAVEVGSEGTVFVLDRRMVRTFSAEGDFLRTIGNPAGSRDGEFISFGIASDRNGSIYMADADNNRVQKFDTSGNLIKIWGGSFWLPGDGDGEMNEPYGIAVGTDGHVYVADTMNHRVQKFDTDGNFIAAWGSRGAGAGQFNEPYGIAVGTDGHVYVADTMNHRVQKFDTDGNIVSAWGSHGSGAGKFNEPNGIAVGVDGHIYVADTMNHRIVKFDDSGKVLASLGSYGTAPGQFNNPQGIVVADAGQIYVADSYNDRIQVFDRKGTFVSVWDAERLGENYWWPVSIALGGDGLVYIGDWTNEQVQVFSATGDFVRRWGGPWPEEGSVVYYPRDMTIDNLDNVYVLQNRPVNPRPENGRDTLSYIHKFAADGTVLARWGPLNTPGCVDPWTGGDYTCVLYDIAVGPAGHVYYLEWSYPRRLVKLDSDGTEVARWVLPAGEDPGQFIEHEPSSVLLDGAGNIYLGDYATEYETSQGKESRIQIFDPGMVLTDVWYPERQSRMEGETYNTSRLRHIDQDGNMFMLGYAEYLDRARALKTTYRVEMFDPQRKLVTRWGSNGVRDSQLNHNKKALATDAAGSVYVANPDHLGSLGFKQLKKFTPVVDPPCDKPSLVKLQSPSKWTEAQPTFEWGAVNGASTYTFQLASGRDQLFAEPYIDKSLSATAYTPPSLPSGESPVPYFWAVRGCSACGCGEWSDTWRLWVTPSDAPPVAEVVCDPAIRRDDPVQLDVLADGRKGWTVHSMHADGRLTISVGIDAGELAGTEADWWLRAVEPGGLQYWFVLQQGWLRSDAPLRAYAGPLRNIKQRTVLETSKAYPGQWRFDFGIDRRDGTPQWSACDTVGVGIEP